MPNIAGCRRVRQLPDGQRLEEQFGYQLGHRLLPRLSQVVKWTDEQQIDFGTVHGDSGVEGWTQKKPPVKAGVRATAWVQVYITGAGAGFR
jgi:hypothetical protein